MITSRQRRPVSHFSDVYFCIASYGENIFWASWSFWLHISRQVSSSYNTSMTNRHQQISPSFTHELFNFTARRSASPVPGTAALSRPGCCTCGWRKCSTSASTWQSESLCWHWGARRAAAACRGWSSTRGSIHAASFRTGLSSSPWQTPRPLIAPASQMWSSFVWAFFSLHKENFQWWD